MFCAPSSLVASVSDNISVNLKKSCVIKLLANILDHKENEAPAI